MVTAHPDTEYRAGELLLSYTRSMVDGTDGWRMVGDYAIWSGNRPNEASPHLLLELIGARVLPVPVASARAILHPVKAGTWFEIRHLFGFWMMSDVDTVWLDAPGASARYYALCIGGAGGRPGKLSFGWVCPSCGVLFNTRAFVVAQTRFEACLDEAQAGVERFNSDDELRKCPECKKMHPLTYGLFAAMDSPPSRAAREAV